MSSGSRWTTISILPVVLLCEAVGWYMARSFLVLALSDSGYEPGELAELTTTTLGAQLVGTLIAGAVAVVAGPYVLLALGAILATAGIYAFNWDFPVLPSLFLFSFGHGMIRPAIYGAAARALGKGLASARVAYFYFMYITVNLGAAVAAPLGASLREPGENHVFGIAGSLVAVAALLAASLAATLHRRRAKDTRSQAKPRARAEHLVVVGVLAVVVAWLFATSGMTHTLLNRAILSPADDGLAPMTSAALLAINPLVVIVVAILAGVAALILQLIKRNFPTTYVAGVGALLLAGGATMALLVDASEPAFGAVIAAFVVLALGEALLIPALLARLLGCLPYRLETAVAGTYMIVMYLPSIIGRGFEDPEPFDRFLAWSSVGTGVIVGLGLIAGAGWLKRLFEADDEPETGPTGRTSPAA